MEYKGQLQSMYDICDALNFNNRDTNQGKFIPEISITSAEGPIKCFKNMHFALYYVYKKCKTLLVTVDYVGKTIDGDLSGSIKDWKLLINSKIIKWIDNGGIKTLDNDGRVK